MAFKKAVKSEAKLRLAVTGPSGSGKTYTALAIATHLADGAGVAMVDTEHGSASKYADIFTFDVLEMTPPFHPDNFVRAIAEAAQAGYAVIILDSLTHAWSGTGGMLDIVDEIAKRKSGGNTFAAWKDATPIQNRLVDGIVGAPIHVIATMRSKQDFAQEKDDRGKTVVRKVGMAPQQRDGFEYEFDVVLDMNQDNEAIVSKTRCPALTSRVFTKPGADVAGILADWLHGVPTQNAPNPSGDTPDGGVVSPPSDEESVILNTWQSPDDAYAWAVNVGACANEHEARNSLKKVVDAYGGGRFRKENAAAIYLAFLRHQMEKLAAQQSDVELAASEPLPF